MSPRGWARLRLAGGAAVLGVLVWRLGTGPFLAGLRTVDATAVVVGLLVGLFTTLCCAWRWSLVVRGRGGQLSTRDAVVAYYRSQFLNSTLPGGVLGDVHRAVRHGLSPVALERTAGQVVQLSLSAVVLMVLPSPVHLPFLVLLACCLPGLAVLVRWPRIAMASGLAVGGHVVAFLVAARTAGADTSLSHLVPLALIVLLAMSLPANVAGWGPREGMAAWAFAAVGLGAAVGIATAVVYGVMALVAVLPGLVVLIVDRRHPPVPVVVEGEPVHA